MNIKYHPDVHGYAVNVKTLHMHFPDGGTEGQRELAWDSTHEDWWNDANEIAKQEGFSGVSGVGRACGWCAPYDVNKGVPENSSRHYCYVQTAYESEIDEDASDPDGMRDEAKRFAKFAERIEEHLTDVPAMYKENLERIIEEDKEEEEALVKASKEAKEMRAETLTLLRSVHADKLVSYWEDRWEPKA